MVEGKYIPDRGEIVWLDFDPQSGGEIRKRRTAIILSPKKYNKKAGLSIVCPITSKIKGYPFEVLVNNKNIKGAILSDQVKSLDWRVRKLKYICKAEKHVLDEVLQKLSVLFSD